MILIVRCEKFTAVFKDDTVVLPAGLPILCLNEMCKTLLVDFSQLLIISVAGTCVFAFRSYLTSAAGGDCVTVA